jgi:hypothetical protein
MAWSASRSFAGPTSIAASELYLLGNPMHGLHKGDLYIIAEIIAGNGTVSPGAGPVATAKAKEITKNITEARENIIGTSRAAIATVFQAIMAIGVVDFSFFLVTQNFIGLSAGLKLFLGILIVGIAVRMILHRKFAIRLFNISGRSVSANG